jgi:hypothetical protein
MSLSVKTRVMLWGRAAGRCSFPGCRLNLVLDATETDDPSLVGEFCHIVADSDKGPRGNSPLTPLQRNSYGNLIVLCSIHHKLIDDQENTYTVERLHTMKQEHETFVASSLNKDLAKHQRSEEIVAGYIDEWVDRCGIDDWNVWTSWLLGGNPTVFSDRFDAIKGVSVWLLSRIWPRDEFPELRRALENFRHVLGGFLMTFDRHSRRRGDGEPMDRYQLEKFYKIPEYNEELYSKLSREYEAYVGLIDDYVYEMTRAANLVCDAVRAELLPDFRLDQGALLATRGEDMNFKTYTFRAEYQAADFPELYQGEKDFNRRRLGRDVHEGTEAEVAYLEKLANERRPPWETE